MLTITVDHSM